MGRVEGAKEAGKDVGWIEGGRGGKEEGLRSELRRGGEVRRKGVGNLARVCRHVSALSTANCRTTNQQSNKRFKLNLSISVMQRRTM